MRWASAVAIVALVASVGQTGDRVGPAILMAPSDMKWVADLETPGGTRARVMGEGTRPGERDVMMLRLEPGAFVPPHHHHGSMCDGVVIGGIVEIAAGCGAPKELPSGSFFFIGGDTVHSLRCRAGGAGCQVFWSQPPATERTRDDCRAVASP